MLINKWINKDLSLMHNGILFRSKKKYEICRKMNGSGKYYSEWGHLDSERQKVHVLSRMCILIFTVCMYVYKGVRRKVCRRWKWTRDHRRDNKHWGRVETPVTWNQAGIGGGWEMGQVSKGKKRVYLKISIMKYNIWILTFRKASRKGLEINMLTNENCAISFPWEKKSRRIILRFRVHSRTFYDICVPQGRGQEMRITQNTTLCGILQLENGLLVIREGSGAPAYKHLFYTASLKLFLHKLILQNQPDWPVHDKAKTNFIQNNSLDNFMRNGIIMSVKTESVKTGIALNVRNRKKKETDFCN